MNICIGKVMQIVAHTKLRIIVANNGCRTNAGYTQLGNGAAYSQVAQALVLLREVPQRGRRIASGGVPLREQGAQVEGGRVGGGAPHDRVGPAEGVAEALLPARPPAAGGGRAGGGVPGEVALLARRRATQRARCPQRPPQERGEVRTLRSAG